MANEYLLLEDGTKFFLQDETGFIALEGNIPTLIVMSMSGKGPGVSITGKGPAVQTSGKGPNIDTGHL